MKVKLFGVVAFVIIFVACFAGLENSCVQASDVVIKFGQNQLTSYDSDQQNPDIYEYDYNWWAAVWQDNRNGNWDIYMYYQKYLGDGNWDVQWDTKITANSGNDINPKIYNDTIVYQSDRNGNWDIYSYNLTSEVETQITTNTADQQFPKIYGDIIVWQDYRNAAWNTIWKTVNGLAIYMYNLTSHTEERLPLLAQNAFSPDVSGDCVVYAEEVYQPWSSSETLVSPYIRSYNLSTGLRTVVAAGRTSYHSAPGIYLQFSTLDMDFPAIDGSIVAWRNKGSQNIGFRNISSDDPYGAVSSSIPYVDRPAVSGTWIVYQAAYWHLKLYDFSTGLIGDATSDIGSQINPAISATYSGIILYQDNRSGRWHIYLTVFWYGLMSGYPSPNPHTPSLVMSKLQDIESTIVNMPTSDFAGANNKVKENRRNAMLNQVDSALASVEAAVNTQNMNLRSKYLQSTIDLLDGVIVKVDGRSQRGIADTPGSGFSPDWVTTYSLDSLVRYCRVELQILLEGIT